MRVHPRPMRDSWQVCYITIDHTVLLIQLDGNLASDVSTRCSGRPQGNENWC